MDTQTIEIESVGRLCGLFQKSPKSIREAAASIGIEPSHIINGVAHYTSRQAELIAEHLSQAVLRQPKPML